MNSFLASDNNWVHSENKYIHFRIKDGPKIEMQFPSLQSYALIVGNKKGRKIDDKKTANQKKVKLSTNILHVRFRLIIP